MKFQYNTRRQFLLTGTTTILGSTLSIPYLTSIYPYLHKNLPGAEFTVQQVIDKILHKVPGDRNPNTVDTLKTGDPLQIVTGIATTFLATVDVIKASIEQNCNLIITHEPTFYNHRDETDWIKDDPVFRYKQQLIKDHKIAIWRFHDYWHQIRPDGILTGFLKEMEWEDLQKGPAENTFSIPSTSLKELAENIKNKFELDRCFFIGDPELSVKTIGILPGSWGREPHIDLLQKDINVLIIGEAAEWETVEYVRDAASAGMDKGLIILGHAKSEEPGMKYLKEWLQPLFPDLNIVHIAAGDPFVPMD